MTQSSPPATDNAPESPYMTLEQAAEYVCMEPKKLERRRRDGKVAYVPTRPPVFVRSELDRMMQNLMKKARRSAV